MKRCSECGARIESDREKVETNLFSFTLMSALALGILFKAAEWNIEWWRDRAGVVGVMTIPLLLAGYSWGQWFALRKESRKG